MLYVLSLSQQSHLESHFHRHFSQLVCSSATEKTTLAFVKDTVAVREHNSYYTSMLAVKVALFEFS